MKTLIAYIAASTLVVLACVFGFFALDWRSPDFAGYRGLALAVAILLALLILLVATRVCYQGWVGRWPRVPSALALLAGVVALGGLGQVVVAESRFHWMRHAVLNSEPARLEALGQHVIVGYRDRDMVRSLGQRRAAAGFFITHHNIEGMSEEGIGREILWLRSQLDYRNPQQVWIATDQEGGGVSRLSPPLPQQPALGQVLGNLGPEGSIEETSMAYGRQQAEGMASLGINLNLAPVVDIDHQVDNPSDRFTRISDRALSDDPAEVTEAAGAYCKGLADFGVQCTLKHFPGIGRVFNDTHVEPAALMTPTDQLREADWLPFRQLADAQPTPWMMLSHVTLHQVDPSGPVSTSDRVVHGLLRDRWGFEGVLITDDFCMRSIQDAPGGIGQASVDALNAGVDVILISYDPDQYYPAMYALLQADRDGRLDADRLGQSKRRLRASIAEGRQGGQPVFPPETPKEIPPSR